MGSGLWKVAETTEPILPIPTSMDLLLWVGSVGPFLLPEPLFHSQEHPGPSQLQFHHWEKRLKPRVGRVCTFRMLPGVGTFPHLPLFVPSTRVSHPGISLFTVHLSKTRLR